MAKRQRATKTAKKPGDHRASGGCGRTWIGLDGLRHVCRAARGAVVCRCPCSRVTGSKGIVDCPAAINAEGRS